MLDTVRSPIQVWDPLVRVGHWVLVAAFAVAYVTEDDLLGVHVWAGYAVGIIVLFRIVWGVVGPRYARFSDFVRAPAAVAGYLRDLVLFRARRYIGHSPGGGAMVVALLLSLAATVGTGLVLYAEEHQAGPLAPFVGAGAQPTAGLLTRSAVADDKRPRERKRDDGGETLEDVHEFLANLTLALILAHVLGVVLASVVHHENLIGAMVTGKKRPNPSP